MIGQYKLLYMKSRFQTIKNALMTKCNQSRMCARIATCTFSYKIKYFLRLFITVYWQSNCTTTTKKRWICPRIICIFTDNDEKTPSVIAFSYFMLWITTCDKSCFTNFVCLSSSLVAFHCLQHEICKSPSSSQFSHFHIRIILRTIILWLRCKYSDNRHSINLSETLWHFLLLYTLMADVIYSRIITFVNDI